MLLASVIKSTSLLLVQWCLLLPTSFFVSDVAAWQAHNPNPVTVTTIYILDLSYYHSLVIVAAAVVVVVVVVVVVTYFLSASPCSNAAHCSV